MHNHHTGPRQLSFSNRPRQGKVKGKHVIQLSYLNLTHYLTLLPLVNIYRLHLPTLLKGNYPMTLIIVYQMISASQTRRLNCEFIILTTPSSRTSSSQWSCLDVRAEPPRCRTTDALATGKSLWLKDLGRI